MKKFKLISLLSVLIFSINSYAQKNISGTITDVDGSPIPGATIIIVGTTTGATSDFDGNYTISASEGQSLEFSSLGF